MKRVLILLVIIFVFLCPAGSARPTPKPMFVTYIDVAQGDCALITLQGESMLIDTGKSSAFPRIQNVLDLLDVESIKYMVLTHPHADHIGSAAKILENYNVQTILMPPIVLETNTYTSITEAIAFTKTPVIHPFVGDTYTLGGATITIYAPHPVAYSNPNDWSLVLKLEYGNASFLFTGDAEYASETDMLAVNDIFPLESDVLKVAHHGSDTSSHPAFIFAVNPQYAVVSCGINSIYPSTDVAMTLFDQGAELLATNVCGTITFKVTFNHITYSTDLKQYTIR